MLARPAAGCAYADVRMAGIGGAGHQRAAPARHGAVAWILIFVDGASTSGLLAGIGAGS